MNNLTTLIISLMVCGLVVGATIPMITAISNETVIEEYNSTDDASWIRMAYGTADYDLEYTLADDTITVGTQSGTADDMILYADEKSCVMSVDGEFVIVNGYIENPEVIKADTVTVTRSAGAITITDGTDTIVSADAPAWAYYPDANGKYAYFGADVDGVKVKDGENFAITGGAYRINLYNNIGTPNVAVNMDVVTNNDVIESVIWTPAGYTPDTDPIPTYAVPSDNTVYTSGDWSFMVSGEGAIITKYNGNVTSSLVIPSTVTYNGSDLSVIQVGLHYATLADAVPVVTNSQLNSGATIVIPEGVKTIGTRAFMQITNANTTLNLPDSLVYIDKGAFWQSAFTGTLDLPDGIKVIESNSFGQCTGLTGSIVLPAGLRVLNTEVFRGCTGLTGSVSIPEGITSLGNGVFRESNFNGTLILPSTLTTVGTNLVANSRFDTVVIMSDNTTFTSTTFTNSMIDTVVNLGDMEITTTSYGLTASDVVDAFPVMGYVAPLSNTVIVQKEGAIFDVLSLLPLVAGIGLLMVAVIYALERRYV